MFNDLPPPPRRPKPARHILPKPPLPVENPLDTQVKDGTITGDIEHDDAVEASEIIKRLDNADRAVKRATKNGYWTCLVFPDEETCYQFLRKAGWDRFMEGFGAYVDGIQAAKSMGIELEIDPIWFRDRKVDKRMVEEVGVFDPKIDS